MKYCHSCEQTYKNAKKFCENCGKKLIEEVKKTEKNKSEKGFFSQEVTPKQLMYILGGIFITVVFAAVLLSWLEGYTSDTTSNYEVANAEQYNVGNRCRYVEEPYIDQESYEVSLNYAVTEATFTEKWNSQYAFYTEYVIGISNTDNVGGTFEVTFYADTSNHGTMEQTKSIYISGHETRTIEAIFDTDIDEEVRGRYSIEPPTKTEYRSVTKYRTVQKCD
jgi:FlaG/FlaF family flagellin (archaellin)